LNCKQNLLTFLNKGAKMALLGGIVKDIKGELKISKIVAFIVMLIVAGFILNWLSSKNATIAKVNPLPAK